MNYSQLFKPIHRELACVDIGLQQLLRSDVSFVSKNIASILNAGGKRFRPALLLMAARLCACSGERAIQLAVAIELLHTATLIHDDVVDNHDLRRGVATMNSHCGNTISILTGDYLYSKAFEILANDGEANIMRCVASTTTRIAQGELVQVQVIGDCDLTEEKYLSIISDKTASLISCACRLGAMSGQTAPDAVDRLARYGHNLGMAFQITDDLLDITGSENLMGKPVGSDIQEGRLTLPLIYTLQSAGKQDAQWIKTTLKSRDADSGVVQELHRMVKRYQGIEYSVKKALEFVEESKKAIGSFGKSEAWESLNLFADYCVGRVC
jgi:octaprenyl-diphosphate synthase